MRSIILATALAAVALASSDQLAFRAPADSIVSTLSLDHAIYSNLLPDHATQLKAHIASLPEKRVVRFANGEEITIEEGQKALLGYQSIRYMDVTDEEIYLRTQAVRESKFRRHASVQFSRNCPRSRVSVIGVLWSDLVVAQEVGNDVIDEMKQNHCSLRLRLAIATAREPS